MTGKRDYDDGCGVAHALELVGERWALLVIRELMLGPKRFTDLRNDLPGISPNVLSQRLSELEASSIVVKRRLLPPAAVTAYELSAWGRELEPFIRDFGRWASRSPSMPQGRPMSVNSIVLSLRTMFNPQAAKGFRGKIGLSFGEHEFTARVSGDRMTVLPGRDEACDVYLRTTPDALAAVIYGGQPLDEAAKAGTVALEGDKRVAQRFVKCFPLPERAPDLRRMG
ncbi:MAG: winged helix-turn-helix transcriptional regulator [Hyphomicrobiales bacterium]